MPRSDRPERAVIVGASLAGAKAAETLRAEGFEGRVTLIGDEETRPYERPPLSKGYLRGESDFDGAAVHEPDFYESNDIDLRTSTRVMALDPANRQVVLESSERVDYDVALLATGAAPRLLTVPGAELPGIRYLRTVTDADALRASVTNGEPVVIIGAGWIGAEVAASARQLGADVTVVEMANVPLERVLGAEVGAVFRDLHLEHGTKFRFGVGIESVGGRSSVEGVTLTDGTVLPAGTVVVGVGVEPRTELAAGARLDVDNGVLTDQYLATSAPGVYAAGDVARALHPRLGEHIRLEHWSSALNQGPAAARNMLGAAAPYEKTPYFFSDQFDLGMEYRGWASAADEVVVRPGGSRWEFLAFWLRGERVAAAMNVNLWDVGDELEALVAGGRAVDRTRLADPDVPLDAL